MVTGAVIRRLETMCPSGPPPTMSPPRRRWTPPSRRSTRSWRSGWPSSRPTTSSLRPSASSSAPCYDVEMMQELGYCTGIENYSRVIRGPRPGLAAHHAAGLLPQGLPPLHRREPRHPSPGAGHVQRRPGPQGALWWTTASACPRAFDNRPLKFDEFDEQAQPGRVRLRHARRLRAGAVGPDRRAGHPAHGPPGPGDRGAARGGADRRPHRRDQRRARSARSGCWSPPSPKRWRRISPPTSPTRASRCATCTTTSTPSSAWRSSATCAWANFDVLVGINLLREGLDLPEVSLVAILDADKEGFLRSRDLPHPDHRPGRPERRRPGDHVRRLHHALHAARPSTRPSAAGPSRTPTTGRTASCPRPSSRPSAT